jgi:hypothetical protein
VTGREKPLSSLSLSNFVGGLTDVLLSDSTKKSPKHSVQIVRMMKAICTACPMQTAALALLRGLVADGSSPDATEWLLERILKHAPPVGAAQGTSAPATKQEILSELPVEHLKHLLTNEERRAFETDGVSTPTAATLLCFCCVLPPADLTWARGTLTPG